MNTAIILVLIILILIGLVVVLNLEKKVTVEYKFEAVQLIKVRRNDKTITFQVVKGGIDAANSKYCVYKISSRIIAAKLKEGAIISASGEVRGDKIYILEISSIT